MDNLNTGTPEPIDSNIDTTVIESGTPEPIEPQQEVKSFKVKHLHEQKEISYDEAPTYIQKGLDYDRVKEKYEELKPTHTFIERLAKQNNMTVNEYMQAVEENERIQEIEAISNNSSLPPELAEELYLARKERKERQELQEQQKIQQEELKKEQDKQQEYVDFLTNFKEVDPEKIPDEVWQIKANDPRLSLSDSYIRYENNQLKEKLKAFEVNKQNAQASTGSVTGNGNVADSDFISFEQFEQNKSNRDWVVKNLTKISKSRAKWQD